MFVVTMRVRDESDVMIVLLVISSLFLTSSGYRSIRPIGKNLIGERNLNLTNHSETMSFHLESWRKTYSVRLKVTHGRKYVSNNTLHCTPANVTIEFPESRKIHTCHSRDQDMMDGDQCLNVLPSDCLPPSHPTCQSFNVTTGYFNISTEKSLISSDDMNFSMTYEYLRCIERGDTEVSATLHTPGRTTTTTAANSRDLIGWNVGGAFAVFLVLFIVGYCLNLKFNQQPVHRVATVSQRVRDEPPGYGRLRDHGHGNVAMETSTNDNDIETARSPSSQ